MSQRNRGARPRYAVDIDEEGEDEDIVADAGLVRADSATQRSSGSSGGALPEAAPSPAERSKDGCAPCTACLNMCGVAHARCDHTPDIAAVPRVFAHVLECGFTNGKKTCCSQRVPRSRM
jgi:hypothetical protein